MINFTTFFSRILPHGNLLFHYLIFSKSTKYFTSKKGSSDTQHVTGLAIHILLGTWNTKWYHLSWEFLLPIMIKDSKVRQLKQWIGLYLSLTWYADQKVISNNKFKIQTKCTSFREYWLSRFVYFKWILQNQFKTNHMDIKQEMNIFV